MCVNHVSVDIYFILEIYDFNTHANKHMIHNINIIKSLGNF